MPKVVTYEAPSGGRVDLCREHRDVVTRNRVGEEHCRVHVGEHHMEATTCVVCLEGVGGELTPPRTP